jgi:hypothetical protein
LKNGVAYTGGAILLCLIFDKMKEQEMNQKRWYRVKIKPSAFVTALPKSIQSFLNFKKIIKSYRLRSGHVILQPGEIGGRTSTNNYEELVIALSETAN